MQLIISLVEHLLDGEKTVDSTCFRRAKIKKAGSLSAPGPLASPLNQFLWSMQVLYINFVIVNAIRRNP